MSRRPKLRKQGKWDSMPWKQVDMKDQDLGQSEDAMFFELEELDGAAYATNSGAFAVKKNNIVDAGVGVEPSSIVAEETDLNTKKKEKEKKRKNDKVDQNKESSDDLVKETKQKKKKKNDKVDQKDQESSNDLAEETKDNKTNDINTKDESKKSLKPKKSEKKRNENKKLRKQKKKLQTESFEGNDDTVVKPIKPIKEDITLAIEEMGRKDWADQIGFHSVLTSSLVSLNFTTPTPIQAMSIPVTIKGSSDVVGAAETGSGKTLAFCLPILESLLVNWKRCCDMKSPHALIIAPTRELAMQISSVLKELTNEFKKAHSLCRLQIVTIVGGLSDHKQRRLLSDKKNKKPIHIVVATPGRLVELIEDDTITAFQDLSELRFLVVDEADRIMEEGHFSELNKVFSRIRSHETIRERGEVPEEVAQKMYEGTYEEGFKAADKPTEDEDEDEEVRKEKGERNDENGESSNVGPDYDSDENSDFEDPDREELSEGMQWGEGGDIIFQAMPSEAQLAKARRAVELKGPPSEGGEDDDDDDDDDDDEEEEEEEEEKEEEEEVTEQKVVIPYVCKRQTLLFSATAIQAFEPKGKDKSQQEKKNIKKFKLQGTLQGLRPNCNIPPHLKELLSIVGIQKTIKVVDATSTFTKDSRIKTDENETAPSMKDVGLSNILPKLLTQYEVRVPMEEKDVYMYYYLTKYPGRILLFVNSIKTARRVDGLLRGLGINARTVHSQLQQKQRLKAMEAFQESPIGVLVATDVAARGLDIARISSVVHYDTARSFQVYVHRSGRTARAGASGTSVTLVSPEDTSFHHNICATLHARAACPSPTSLPVLSLQLEWLPMLRARVKIAKKMFTMSFVQSQATKDKNWLTQTAKESDLEIDDYMVMESESYMDKPKDKHSENENKFKLKTLNALKQELAVLLETPLEGDRAGGMTSNLLGGAPTTGGRVQRQGRSEKKLAKRPQIDTGRPAKRGKIFVYTPM